MAKATAKSTYKDPVLVILDDVPRPVVVHLSRHYQTVFAPTRLRSLVEGEGSRWMSLDDFVDPGSIYEASALTEELSRMKLMTNLREFTRIVQLLRYLFVFQYTVYTIQAFARNANGL